jgi:16S rRNA (uracil1498-N3)-methyltransferase
MTIRRFYASTDRFSDGLVTLSDEETRHLRNVLRVKAGDEAQVFDSAGKEFRCTVIDIPKSGAILRIEGEIEPTAPESDLAVTLAVSAYKNDKLDLVVQKAVELGVARLSPVVTHRGEVTLRDTLKRTERWRKIALEATKQCERALIMRVDDPVGLPDYIDGIRNDAGTLLIFSEKGGGAVPDNSELKSITALIGPKGGWEDSEIDAATGRGFIPVKLGRRIMRAETAAIAFAALLQHRFGDLR